MSSSSMCVLRGLGCFQCGYTRNTRSKLPIKIYIYMYIYVYKTKENRLKSKSKIARMKRAKKDIKAAAARPTTSDRSCNYNV